MFSVCLVFRHASKHRNEPPTSQRSHNAVVGREAGRRDRSEDSAFEPAGVRNPPRPQGVTRRVLVTRKPVRFSVPTEGAVSEWRVNRPLIIVQPCLRKTLPQCTLVFYNSKELIEYTGHFCSGILLNQLHWRRNVCQSGFDSYRYSAAARQHGRTNSIADLNPCDAHAHREILIESFRG